MTDDFDEVLEEVIRLSGHEPYRRYCTEEGPDRAKWREMVRARLPKLREEALGSTTVIVTAGGCCGGNPYDVP